MAPIKEGKVFARLHAKARVRRAQLLRSTSRSLRRRRWIARLSALALVDTALVALRQLGAIRHLPDLPLSWIDSNAVTTSLPAYLFGTPDAALAAGSYAFNLIAAGAGEGGKRTSRASKMRSLLLAANALGGAIGAAGYLWNMLTKRKRLCPYCLATIALNFALLPIAALEARAALRHS
jgi:uncharacterized membrane protein